MGAAYVRPVAVLPRPLLNNRVAVAPVINLTRGCLCSIMRARRANARRRPPQEGRHIASAHDDGMGAPGRVDKPVTQGSLFDQPASDEAAN
jgi:hypothetical protein